jgi:hypothetical protein
MTRRNFLTALSLGSGTLFSFPAIVKTGGSTWQPDG